MVFTFRPAVIGFTLAATALCAGPALADVFSSQDFSGGTATIEQLPGVNLDVVPGNSASGNCVEEQTMAFSTRAGNLPQRATTCRFGNFSITSSSTNGSALYDTTYGGNPPPWVPRWRQ